MFILLIFSPRFLSIIFIHILATARWCPTRFQLDLQIKLAKKRLRMIHKIQRIIITIVDSCIRSRFQLPVPGADQYIDDQLWNAIERFFDWKKAIINSDGEYVKYLLEDNEIVSYRNVYFKLSHYWRQFYGDSHEVASIHRLIFGRTFEAFTEADIGRLYLVFRMKFWKYHLLQNTQAKRINFSISDLINFFPVFSVMLIVGGYFHVHLLYGNFGINHSYFFSINDYLAISIEQILPGLWCLAGFIVAWVSFRNSTPLLVDYEQILEHHTSKLGFAYYLFRRYGYSFLSAVSATLLILIFLEYFPIDPKLKPALILTLFLFVARGPVVFISEYYFERPPSTFPVLMAIIIFFASVYLYTQKEIYGVEKKQREAVIGMKNRQQIYTEIRTNFIGANSRYIFVLSDENKVEIIPINNVTSMRLNSKIPPQ